ncbi:uncharacterized protein MONOS_6910 [Monocercomonoides exilis]|uniref:uncharacterized protein n=1 Tax=Monocercomonoides exilis TaxID=2049356 RepID=UPI00355A70E9|nr:hypothetical protein MONOS_6910 [Monocercomonoides exilis]|eukprot:MONOS_6910.1-p1 / transcript=MONOS_6910.1 / gene=MONOS_6910 / organism=Monocercomonoides_exilis_PA203 / gene_product=unspecified product / transcript_product=unspecified product / location=Mono_scaffold00226:69186-69854(+) / protein_length=160 / sequence_SO=supercontig / SO=protein_coding / is_pseudo=false
MMILAWGASALTVPTTLTTDVEINNNVLEVCAAGASAKWGAVFADLSKESMIRVVNSKVIQCGCSLTMGRGGGLYLALNSEAVDLMDFIMIYQSETIVVSSIEGKGGKDIKKCGTAKDLCYSIEYGATHLAVSDDLRIRMDGAGEIGSELELKDVCVLV